MFPSLIALWSLLSGAAMNPAQSHDPLYYFTSSLLYQCEVSNRADLSYILAQVTQQINDKIFYFYKLCKRSSFFDLFFYNFDETVPNFIRLLWENRILSQADKQNEPCWNRSSGLWLVVRVKKERQTAYVLYVLCLSVFVTAQYPHSYEQKSISNRLRRWDFCLQACVLLRSAQQVRRPTEQLPVFFLFYFLYLRDLSLFSLTEKSGPGHSQILSQIRLPISVVPTCFMPSSMISTVR